MGNEYFSSREFLAFSILIFVVLCIAAIVPIYPNDLFPVLRIGQEVLNTRKIPTTEFMTYTNFGSPAQYFYWLPSLFLLGVYELGGMTLTVLTSMLFIGSFYALLWAAFKELKIGALASMVALILMAFVHALFFTMRPQVLAYPLFGLAFLIVAKWQNNENRLLWALPIISMLWTNTHGSFIVLFLILFSSIIFGSGNTKQLAFFTFLAMLFTLINYYGFDAWLNIRSMVNNRIIRSYITEWLPPVNEGWQLNLFFLGILVMPALTAFSKKKIKIIYWVWYLGFGWMALTSVRHVIWFLPIQASIFAKLINPHIINRTKNSRRFTNRSLNQIIGIIFLSFPLLLLPGVRDRWLAESPPEHDAMTPVDAAEWLKENPHLPDNLWSDFHFSSYFTYEIPERKLFMSNRIEDLTFNQLRDYYQISAAIHTWQSLLDKYNINLVIPGRETSPELIDALLSSPIWKEIYCDQQAIIFLRNY